MPAFALEMLPHLRAAGSVRPPSAAEVVQAERLGAQPGVVADTLRTVQKLHLQGLPPATCATPAHSIARARHQQHGRLSSRARQPGRKLQRHQRQSSPRRGPERRTLCAACPGRQLWCAGSGLANGSTAPRACRRFGSRSRPRRAQPPPSVPPFRLQTPRRSSPGPLRRVSSIGG
jgi:hypothetical protein